MALNEESQLSKHGRWTKEEHMLFLLAVGEFGKDWKEVHNKVPGRTLTQIRSHAQKHFKKEKERERLHGPAQLFYAPASEQPLRKYFQFLNALRACPHAAFFYQWQQQYRLQTSLRPTPQPSAPTESASAEQVRIE